MTTTMTLNPSKKMRITLPYLLPLVFILLLIVALQPARAETIVPPCKASGVTLYGADRADYAGEAKSYAAELQTKAVAYNQSANSYAAQLTAEAGDHQASMNATAADYKNAGKNYMAAANATAEEYRTAGTQHQAETVATHKKYMAAGCDLSGWEGHSTAPAAAE